jgi:predicted MFS family arabinose efflux permease
MEGFSYVRSQAYLFQALVLGLGINFFGAIVSILVAPYVRNVLGGGPAAYGFLLAAFALGAILGVSIAGRMNLRGHVGRAILLAVLFAGGAFAGLGLVHVLWAALLLAFAAGLALPFANVPLEAMIQSKVPNRILGRVSATLGGVIGLAQPVAALVAGAAASQLGIGVLYFASGVAVVLLAILGFLAFPELAHASY